LSGKGNEPGFWLGKYEMTRREFDLVTRKKPRGALASQPNHPRDAIRYDDILLYVEELNRRERFFNRLPGNWEYALPTDAEWEYASRAGSKTRFYFGSSPKLLPAHANFADRNLLETGDEYYHYADGGLDDGSVQLAPVGSYRPNPWGFHDLYGNLWEWTASSGERTEQQSPVARGCSWVSIPAYCDSSFTHRFARDTERNFIGFRLALRKKLAQPAP
jgi:formylglycine-generating enzyme required for sulfatase activity